MTGLRIYIEGGGDSRHQKRPLRVAFGRFLKPLRDLARERQMSWELILCGSRHNTYEDYLTALRVHRDSINFLLVDAEGPVDQAPWRHLLDLDGWDKPPSVDDVHCHLMAQAVEAWLIADPEALADYYGQGFRRQALPRHQDVEAIPKDDLLTTLERASQHCERLFSTVEKIISSEA